jgi:hypothetical protein
VTYSEWNDEIASFLFNEVKGSDQQVLLFITKEDIVRLGVKEGKDQAFQEFILALKSGKDGNPVHPINGALQQFNSWKEVQNKENTYPSFIAYLVLFILPLTETSDRNYNANNYYDRVNDFLYKYGILDHSKGEKIDTWNFRLLDPLWTSLEDWSIMICNLRYGYFNLTPFKNKNWKYVGKPLSQAIFSPKSINRLPVFFDDAGLMPGDDISDETFRQKLLRHGKESLRVDEGLLGLVRNKTELGDSILDITRSVYNTWSGYIEINEEGGRIGYTVAPLKLCIEYDASSTSVSFFYRVFSSTDYPEDLCFSNAYPCKHIYKGWSSDLAIPFADEITLEDKENKWKVRTGKKDLRILIPGVYYDFNEWIEVSEFHRDSEMLLLVKDSLRHQINLWLEKLNCKFVELPAQNIWKKYSLIRMTPPFGELTSINGIAFRSDKRIITHGGVKLAARTYLTGFLPNFSIENAVNGDSLLLYVGDNPDKQSLIKNAEGNWELPSNLPLDIPACIKIEPVDEKNKELVIRISGYGKSMTSIDEDLLPKRDAFGKIIANNDRPAKYAIGSKAIGIPPSGQQVYDYWFRPLNASGACFNKPVDFSLLANDAMLNMLTAKGKCNSREYFEAFEVAYNEKYSPSEIYLHPPLARLKRWSLNLLDYMGFLDFEYSTSRIVINAPQLIRIPASSGSKVLLIGGRTPSLMETMAKNAGQNGIDLEITAQDQSLAPYMLPNSIVLSAFGQKNFEVETKFKALAKSCDILFDNSVYPQYSLAEFSGNIDEYEASLSKDEFLSTTGWTTKVFNPETLKFEKTSDDSFHSDYFLVEYKLNEYTYLHKLWKNGESYSVDKNWGRYLILRHFKKNVISIDYDNGLTAVPSNVPLPRLIEEAMTLFNGTAPRRKRMRLDGAEMVYNIYENIPQIFAKNYFKKVGQKITETQIPLS